MQLSGTSLATLSSAVLLFASAAPPALAQVPVGAVQRPVPQERAQGSNPQNLTPQQQAQALQQVSAIVGKTETIENIERRLNTLEERVTTLRSSTPRDTAPARPAEENLAEKLGVWLRRWGQWGLLWGFLWWIPWFVFSWQWWRRRFWVFWWPWPLWWWLPWFWFIPWFIWGWWWFPVWWGWWIWVWWWIPWIFWIPWWLIVLKHCLQWLAPKRP